MQERRNSIAYALEFSVSYTHPLISSSTKTALISSLWACFVVSIVNIFEKITPVVIPLYCTVFTHAFYDMQCHFLDPWNLHAAIDSEAPAIDSSGNQFAWLAHWQPVLVEVWWNNQRSRLF